MNYSTKSVRRLLLSAGHSYTLVLLYVVVFPTISSGQNYFGFGLHLTPPVYLENTSNPYVVAMPQPGVAFSATYKREWIATKRRNWYIEGGITTQSLRYYQNNYTGDTVTIWSDYTNRHIGFPSLLIGGGISYEVFKSRGQISAGLESTLLIAQDLNEIITSSYGIVFDPGRHQVFPGTVRLNLGYQHNIRLTKRSIGHLRFYTSLTPQKVTKGDQTIRNLKTGETKTGAYHLNNSELGLKLFIDLKNDKIKPLSTQRDNNGSELLPRKSRYRMSVYGQLFRPSPAVYHVPQFVDSFSLTSRQFILNRQAGLTLEVPFRKNNLWSTVFSVGVGERAGVVIFNANSNYTPTGMPITVEQSINGLGYYGICNIGLSRRHALRKRSLSHTLTTSFVFPLSKEKGYFGVPMSGPPNQFPPFENPIMEGDVNANYGRDKVLLGLEYNPEFIITARDSYFIAVGLVGNYSRGVITQGRFRVTNNTTTYYGAVIQGFSKIGISARCGFGG
jgi:hypothetical protein